MDHAEFSCWVIVIPIADVSTAPCLRQVPQVEVLLTEQEVWFRGPLARLLEPTRAAASLEAHPRRASSAASTSSAQQHATSRGDPFEKRLLRLLPGARPYLLAGDGQLTLLGDRVPSHRLPEGRWISFRQWLQIQLPSADPISICRVAPISVTLVRSFDAKHPNLLITSGSELLDYVTTAPAWRLERLAFAASPAGRVVVRGTPLLSIPGEQWVEREGIATRAGWTWTPAIDAKILRRKLGLLGGDVVLIEGSRWTKISESHWVRLTRSAVRSTFDGIQHAS